LDFECIRPFDRLLLPTYPEPHPESALQPLYQTAYFAQMGRNASFIHAIPNAWMASTPFHPFFMLPLEVVPNLTEKPVEEVTGPVALRNEIHRYDEEFKAGVELVPYLRTKDMGHAYFDEYELRHSVSILSTDVIYPYAWNGDGVPAGFGAICSGQTAQFDRQVCLEGLKVWERGAHCITYWTHTW
jgi:inositol phosphorylceramide mannosyltransferase catalytic subunit